MIERAKNLDQQKSLKTNYVSHYRYQLNYNIIKYLIVLPERVGTGPTQEGWSELESGYQTADPYHLQQQPLGPLNGSHGMCRGEGWGSPELEAGVGCGSVGTF